MIEKYQKRRDGAKEESVKPSQVSIGKKSPSKRSKIGSTTPDLKHISRSHIVQIIHCVQIQYQIPYQTHRGKFLKRFISYKITKKLTKQRKQSVVSRLGFK